MSAQPSAARWRVADAPPPVPAGTVTGAIADLLRGQPFVLLGPEGGGTMVVAGQRVRPSAITFMARHARGLVSVVLAPERAEQLGLRAQPRRGGRPFMVPIEARSGVTTGISAADRARTIGVVADPASTPEDLVRPGHVVPVLTHRDGVLGAVDVGEAAVDLTRLAGLTPVAAVCQVLDSDGAEARGSELARICRKHRLRAVSVSDVAAYRRCREEGVERAAEAMLPTRNGEFRAIGFRSLVDDGEHLALIYGDPAPGQPALVRVQQQCLAGEVFRGFGCDCGENLRRAMQEIAAHGSGVIVHLGSGGQLRCALARGGEHAENATQSPDLGTRRHENALAAGILRDLGVRSVTLLLGSHERPRRLDAHGVKVAGSASLRGDELTACSGGG